MDNQQVYCQVCQRPSTSQLEFFCCGCARASIWNTRIHHTQALLDKERLSGDVSNIIQSDKPAVDDSNEINEANDDATRTATMRRLEVETKQADELKMVCMETCAEIKKEIAALKVSINQRRDEVAQRKATVAANKKTIAAQLPKSVPAQQENVQKIEAEWSKLHSAICQDRVLLCREVAKIYGLELKKRRRDSIGRDVFLLGGTPVVDLRDLNNASPKLITVSAGRLAHMLHLTSHYLAVQLPAQIDLPSPGNPHTVIYTPTTSYKQPTLPTGRKPGVGLSSTAGVKSRQRILHVDKPLPTLAAEDQVAYSLFIDAISLLAWDLAWLAKSQGIDIGSRHWEDVCAMGRVVWLLFGPQSGSTGTPSALRGTPPPNYQRRPSTTPSSSEQASSAAAMPNPHQPLVSSPMARTPSGGSRRTPGADDPGAAGPVLPQVRGAHPGFYSHDSTRAFLPAAPAVGGMADALRTWQFASPIRLIERIKAALANDRAGAEWEMLDKEEWAGAEDDAAVTAEARYREGQVEEQGQQRPTGWMRLRTKTGGLL